MVVAVKDDRALAGGGGGEGGAGGGREEEARGIEGKETRWGFEEVCIGRREIG